MYDTIKRKVLENIDVFRGLIENDLWITEPNISMHVFHVGRAFARLVVFSLCIGLLHPLHAQAASPLVIGEVAWSGSSLSTSDEWVELWNMGDQTISLQGYRLFGAGSETGIVFRAEDQIAPYGTFVIANFHATDTRSVLEVEANLVTSTLSLSNDKLGLSFVDVAGTIIDQAGNGRLPLAGTSTHNNVSMVRVLPQRSGTEVSSWTSADRSEHLKTGLLDRGTPGVCDGCVLLVPEPRQTPPLDVINNSSPVVQMPRVSISTSTTSTPEIVLAPIPSVVPEASSSSLLIDLPSETVIPEVPTEPMTTVTPTTMEDTFVTPVVTHETTLQVETGTTTTTAVPTIITMTPTTSSTTSTTTLVEMIVPQSHVSSSAVASPLHLQLALTLNHAVYINVPASDHSDEYTALYQLLNTLFKEKDVHMAMMETDEEADQTPSTPLTMRATKLKAPIVKTTTLTKKAPTVKKVSVTKKKTSVAKKKVVTKPAPMSTTIAQASTIATDTPRVFLMGTVASIPQLLGKNQFVIQSPDGRVSSSMATVNNRPRR